MFAKTFVLTVAICIMATAVSAKIWRVDSNTGNQADFSDLAQAHAGAESGDTLYVAGSLSEYADAPKDSVHITKRLYIIGPGYFLQENFGNQSTILSATVKQHITFAKGSEGSLLTGMDVGLVKVLADRVVIKRNRCNTLTLLGSATNVAVLQNFFYRGGASDYSFQAYAGVRNVVVNNNYIHRPKGTEGCCSFTNNVLDGAGGTLIISRCILTNNIISSISSSGASQLLDPTRNILSNNIRALDDSDIFVESGTTDGQYKLRAGSSAIGAGVDGVDLGMFGGPEPYVLSGLTTLPSIYLLDVRTTGSTVNGLPVHLKARTEKP
ncbi:MAG: hypothetical protein HOC74_21665 [Gemmatimonadetes bacterium]|jgi:hypothetical protein|nr:hypothetical protein [Gemmatimonadota bacterium]